MSVRAVILAAGQGTRMRCDLPKVLHTVAGRPIVAWAVEAVLGAGADQVAVVVGHGSDLVAAALPDGVVPVAQETQGGTGHAARVALEALRPAADDVVLILPGDSPLLGADTLSSLLALAEASGAAGALLTARLPDPTGYGRVVRDGASVVAIVEHADADEATRKIDEVAVSTYAFRADALEKALGKIRPQGAKGEEYLTDVIALLAADGGVVALAAGDHTEALGVNTHHQLADVDAVMRQRINRSWMEAGVWMQDPATAFVDAGVSLEAGVRLMAGVHLEGATRVAAGAVVGPQVFAADSTIDAGSHVWYSVLRGVTVEQDVEVGPFASLRHGTVMRRGSKAGTFVEIKASEVGEGSKVPHLSYVGDASIGSGSNLGAGSITCNWDGERKHRTVIGDGVFIGSDTMLVAPVEVGDGAYTGAGSVITRDVAPGALAVERSQQRELPGYAERRSRSTKTEGD